MCGAPQDHPKCRQLLYRKVALGRGNPFFLEPGRVSLDKDFDILARLHEPADLLMIWMCWGVEAQR